MLGNINILNNVEDHQVEDREDKSEGGFPAAIPCYTCEFPICTTFVFLLWEGEIM